MVTISLKEMQELEQQAQDMETSAWGEMVETQNATKAKEILQGNLLITGENRVIFTAQDIGQGTLPQQEQTLAKLNVEAEQQAAMRDGLKMDGQARG